MALWRSSDIIGKEVDGYQIEEELGRGGMGIVYKAVDTSLDRVVAVKVMNPLLVEDEQFFRRFKVEAKTLGRLKHPNIVSVFTLRHTEDYLFIVMEYVDGGTLMDLISYQGAIPWHNAVPFIQQTLNAVDYAHRQHVIHRDIKPRNILITSSGIAKVTDFGLAKIQDLSAATLAVTKTGITGGTLYYMSPEQLEGLTKVDHRGDIYSLGMTYYVMLAGRSPFEKLSSEFAVLKAIDAHDFPALGELDRDIPEPLVQIVTKAVERDPSDRFQSAGEMLGAVQAWQSQSSSETALWSATRPLMPSPTRPLSRRRRQKRERNTNSLLKRIKAWLAKIRSEAGPQETSGRQSAKKDPFPTPESAQAGSTPARARVASQPETVATPQVFPSLAETDLDETIADEAPVATSSSESQQAQPGATEPQHKPLPLQEAAPEPEAFREPDDLSEKEHLESTLHAPIPFKVSEKELHTTRPLWKRPAFRASLAVVVLLGLLSVALVRPLFLSPSGQSGGPVADAVVNLTIRTIPEATNVYLNGERVGRTPLIGYPTTAGTTTLRLEKTGYVSLDTSLTVDANETAALSIRLQPQPDVTEGPGGNEQTASGSLVFRSQPSGADILLGTRRLGRTPFTLRDFEAGAHQFVLRKEGFKDYVASATVEPGQATRVTASLVPLTGMLRILVRPFGDIYINDERKASATNSPLEEELPVGLHRIRAVHPMLGTWEKLVRVHPDEAPNDVLFKFNDRFRVLVTSEPRYATIIVDGKATDQVTPGQISLPPGQHTIEVRKEGFVMKTEARSITLERNLIDHERIHFMLEEQ